MSDFDEFLQRFRGQGAWIFISHSNKDFEKVRKIRNYLETWGHKPLLFYLKCLENNDARLPELIKEEIAAREWFILCDSPNAKESDFVQEEVRMIRAMKGKVFKSIDLTKGLEVELPKIDEILKRANVFFSYAHDDAEIAERMIAVLEMSDFNVLYDSHQIPGKDLGFESLIDEAVSHGFVLVLLSPVSLRSVWCQSETLYALKKAAASHRSNVIPIIIEPIRPGMIPSELRHIQWFDLTTGSFDDRMKILIHTLKTREME